MIQTFRTGTARMAARFLPAAGQHSRPLLYTGRHRATVPPPVQPTPDAPATAQQPAQAAGAPLGETLTGTAVLR